MIRNRRPLGRLSVAAGKQFVARPSNTERGVNCEGKSNESHISRVEFNSFIQIYWAFSLMMVVAYGCIKLSLIFFYRRLFIINRGTFFDMVTRIAIVFVILWTIGFLFTELFECGSHFDAIWGNVLKNAKYCPGFLKNALALFITDFATDVMILAMPIPVVRAHPLRASTQSFATRILTETLDLATPYVIRAQALCHCNLGISSHVSKPSRFHFTVCPVILMICSYRALAASATRVGIFSEITIRGFDPYEDINREPPSSSFPPHSFSLPSPCFNTPDHIPLTHSRSPQSAHPPTSTGLLLKPASQPLDSAFQPSNRSSHENPWIL